MHLYSQLIEKVNEQANLDRKVVKGGIFLLTKQFLRHCILILAFLRRRSRLECTDVKNYNNYQDMFMVRRISWE